MKNLNSLVWVYQVLSGSVHKALPLSLEERKHKGLHTKMNKFGRREGKLICQPEKGMIPTGL